MARLALYTFGVFREPADSPVNQGFHDRNDPMFTLVDRSHGFVARAGYDDEPGSELWGEQVYPRFYVERGDGWSPSTLSLWRDLEAAMAFSYCGAHAEALKHGREWFVEPAWPPYVAWWVADDHRPDWAEAVMRHELLHDSGSIPAAFTFKQAFDADGNPTKAELRRMKQMAQHNAGAITRD